MEEFVSTPSQGEAEDTHSPSTYKSQLLQMFADMEETTKQQALFDHEWEQAVYDRENASREWEELASKRPTPHPDHDLSKRPRVISTVR